MVHQDFPNNKVAKKIDELIAYLDLKHSVLIIVSEMFTWVHTPRIPGLNLASPILETVGLY